MMNSGRKETQYDDEDNYQLSGLIYLACLTGENISRTQSKAF
jgi:hypothetical protein